jgi:maltose phosphorylase
MAGTWLAIVEGFGGMRIIPGGLSLCPALPEKWKSYSFHARYREIGFAVKVTRRDIEVRNLSARTLRLMVFDDAFEIKAFKQLILKNRSQ